MSLRQEIQEFVDELTRQLNPGEPWNVHAHTIVREGVDVIGELLAAGANVDELSNEAVAAAMQLLVKLNLGVIPRRVATTAIPWIVPPIVEQLAGYSGTAQEFVDAQILPRLDEWIVTLTDVRTALAPAT